MIKNKTINNFKDLYNNIKIGNIIKNFDPSSNKILYNSEYGYDKRNKKKLDKDDNSNIYCSLVYYFPNDIGDKIDITYNSNFNYILDLKVPNLDKQIAKKNIDYIFNKIKKYDRFSLMTEDNNMKKYEETHKKLFSNNKKYNIYYLKAVCSKDLIDLLKNKKITVFNPYIYKILKNNFDLIDNNNNIDIIIENIIHIVNFYKKLYYEQNNTQWIKSQGEFYCLISLIILLKTYININQKFIENPIGKKLEIDFYLHSHNIAIEIDGTQHKNKNIQINDKIKNILLETGNIKLIRISWDNNRPKDFFNEIYDNFNKISNENVNINENLNINKDIYLKIIDKIQTNIIFPSFSYKFKDELFIDINKNNIINDDEKNTLNENVNYHKIKSKLLCEEKYNKLIELNNQDNKTNIINV
jgi:hypothetical protein